MSQESWSPSMQVYLERPWGRMQDSPMGQQVPLMELSLPHVSPSCTVFRQVGKLY